METRRPCYEKLCGFLLGEYNGNNQESRIIQKVQRHVEETAIHKIQFAAEGLRNVNAEHKIYI